MSESEAKQNGNPIVKAPIEMSEHGLVLRTFDDMYRFGKCVVASRLAPKSFTTPEQVMIAIQSGAELGMRPMRALDSFCVINGAARLYGDAPLALVRQSGLMQSIKEHVAGEGDSRTALCITKRKGDPEPKTTSFSVADAKRAGLWGKQGPWKNYPDRMLMYRARSFNLRDNFPDCFGGATIAEEYQGHPEAAYEPTTPRRADRKQVQSVPVASTDGDTERTDAGDTEVPASDNPLIRGLMDGLLRMFKERVEAELDIEVPDDSLGKSFKKFAAMTLGGAIVDYDHVRDYDEPMCQELLRALQADENDSIINLLVTEIHDRLEPKGTEPLPSTAKLKENDALFDELEAQAEAEEVRQEGGG